MKKLLQSYLAFSRTERYGIMALLLLMLILLAIRWSMHLWVAQPAVDAQQVVIAARKIKQQNSGLQRIEKAKLPPGVKINLNTADSLTLISLPGIGKGLSHRILERRRRLGKFTNMEQVLEVYNFKQETREILLQSTVVE